jgi:uncharacterized RDD family membrane protein YckC
MTDSGPGQTIFGVGVKPHAYDPIAHPELFEGVLARRMLAYLVDLIVIVTPVILGAMFIFLFGIFTLGLGWGLFFLVSPASVIWALFYYGITMGGSASATIGMRMFDLEVRTWYGAPCYFLLGTVHAIAFWVLISALTPLVLFVGFFNERRRLLHDFLVGTVVINTERRATALRQRGWPVNRL